MTKRQKAVVKSEKISRKDYIDRCRQALITLSVPHDITERAIVIWHRGVRSPEDDKVLANVQQFLSDG